MSAVPTDDDLTRTAYHEAGHAVLHLFLSLGCSGVTIEPDFIAMNLGASAHGGFGKYAEDFGEEDDDIANLRLYAEDAFYIRHAIACYAGAEATRRWNPAREDWREGAEGDDEAANEFLDMCAGDDQALLHLAAYAHRRSEILVGHYWPEICAVAEALLAAKKFQGDEVQQLCMASLKARRGGLMGW